MAETKSAKTVSRLATSMILSTLLSTSGAWLQTTNHAAFAAADAVPSAAEKVDLLVNKPPLLKWNANGTPKGVVLCLHELGMYSGVFQDTGTRLAKSGYIVYAMDERGFGGWEKIKGPDSKMNLDKTLADIKD